jgi:Flp pilus assembly protein TadG
MARIRRWLRQRPRFGDKGQALVEFALVAPILILLVVGIFEFARAWQAFQVLTDAAREGARNAVIDHALTATDVENIVRQALDRAALNSANIDSLGVNNLTGGGAWTRATAARGDQTEVFLSYNYAWIWLRPLLGWFGSDGTVTLKTNIIMRQE